MNNHLKKLLTYYALHSEGQAIDDEEAYINDVLNVMEIIKRIINDDSNYFNADYADGAKLYIDGCAEYLSKDEYILIKRFFKKDYKNE